MYGNLFHLENKRRVIISTNIGESSITLPHCVVVIDFCLTRKKVMVAGKGFSKFETRLASRSNLIQRAGRVGRTCAG